MCPSPSPYQLITAQWDYNYHPKPPTFNSLKLDISAYLSTPAGNEQRYLQLSASLLHLLHSLPSFEAVFNSHTSKRMHSTCGLTIKAIWFEYVTMSLPFQLN